MSTPLWERMISAGERMKASPRGAVSAQIIEVCEWLGEVLGNDPPNVVHNLLIQQAIEATQVAGQVEVVEKPMELAKAPAFCCEFPKTQATRNPETSMPEITISYDRISVALDIDYHGIYRFHHPFWNEHPKPGDGKCWCGVKLDSEHAVKFEFRKPNLSIDDFWMPRTDTPENLPIAVGKGFYKMPKRRENLWWLDA